MATALFFAIPSGAGQPSAPVLAPPRSSQLRPLDQEPDYDEGNWTTFLGDPTRASSSISPTDFDPQSAANLSLLWKAQTGGPLIASPVEASGTIYQGSWDGYEYAFAARNGSLLWRTYLGQANGTKCQFTYGISSTPTIANGTLYVGGGDGKFYAVNDTNGAILWSVVLGSPSAGYYLWASPLIYHGFAYMGVASGCDEPLVPGGLAQISLATHSLTGFFATTPKHQRGGSIWASPTLDPSSNSIFVVTGNPGYRVVSPYTEAVISLNATTLAVQSSWQVPAIQASPDGDFGATPTIVTADDGHKLVVATNKDGYTYAWNESNLGLGPLWADRLSGRPTLPAVAPASFDGNRLFVGSVNASVGGKHFSGGVFGVNPTDGSIDWAQGMAAPVQAAPVQNQGIVVVPFGHRLTVRSAADGSREWQYIGTKGFNSAPVILAHRILAGSFDGYLYAFGLPLRASIVANLSQGTSPLTVAMSARVIGGIGPIQYTWTGVPAADTQLAAFNLTFGTPGSYTIGLMVSDAAGHIASATPITVSVSQPVPGRRPLRGLP